MARRPSGRSLSFQVAALVMAVAAMLYATLRTGSGESEAQAAPAPAARASRPAVSAALALSAAPTGSAASVEVPPATEAKPESALDPDAGAPADAIDLAIAPAGGVPTHPGATAYKSPFAVPNAAQPVKVKVGMLLNSID